MSAVISCLTPHVCFELAMRGSAAVVSLQISRASSRTAAHMPCNTDIPTGWPRTRPACISTCGLCITQPGSVLHQRALLCRAAVTWHHHIQVHVAHAARQAAAAACQMHTLGHGQFANSLLHTFAQLLLLLASLLYTCACRSGTTQLASHSHLLWSMLKELPSTKGIGLLYKPSFLSFLHISCDRISLL